MGGQEHGVGHAGAVQHCTVAVQTPELSTQGGAPAPQPADCTATSAAEACMPMPTCECMPWEVLAGLAEVTGNVL